MFTRTDEHSRRNRSAVLLLLGTRTSGFDPDEEYHVRPKAAGLCCSVSILTFSEVFQRNLTIDLSLPPLDKQGYVVVASGILLLGQ
jgi:hypothetical protein